MTGRGLRPIAFLLAMVGFGVRLDTAWQGTGAALLVVAAVLAAAGLRPMGTRPFVPEDDRR
jgi:hypothetical protein